MEKYYYIQLNNVNVQYSTDFTDKFSLYSQSTVKFDTDATEELQASVAFPYTDKRKSMF